MTKKQSEKNNKISLAVIAFVVCVSAFSILSNNLGFDYNGKHNAQANRSVESLPAQAYSKITDNENLLTDEQTALLHSYAQRYADTLYYVQPQRISQLYADTQSQEYQVNKTALDILASIRGMRDIDLTLEYAEVEYTIDKVEKKGSTVTVHLKENNTQKFRHLEEPSYSANLYHKFTLMEQNDSWKIKKHYHEEDFYLLAIEGWQDATGADNAEKGENAFALIIADAKENLADISQFQQGTYYTNLNVADTSYDRQRAVDYAQQWWNERNYNGRYLAYDDFGGNCQNFASQCLYAGGIRMDNTGTIDNQWKFYSEVLNSKQTASGRSYSWTGVDMFYSYAVASYKSGLVSLTDIDYRYAEKGDIIHVGAYYQWRHALLITDVIKNEDGSVKEIIVASNTADRWNYPLSAYIYTAPRLIHILGQN